MNKVSLIGDEYEIDMSIIKMEQVASHLVGLLRHQKISRTELAKDLGWSKGRVTKVLSGDVNLTLRTITTITQKLGYDFDVIYHNKNYDKPKQPWQIDRDKYFVSQTIIHNDISTPNIALELHTGAQVVNAVLAGEEKDFYVSITQSPQITGENPVQVTRQLALDTSPINITYLKEHTKVVCYE